MLTRWNSQQSNSASTKNFNRKTILERRGKTTTRGVWSPLLMKGGSSFAIYDDPSKDLFLQEWLIREDEDRTCFNRHYVGDRYALRKNPSDDTQATVSSSDDENDDENTIQLTVKQRSKTLPRGPGAFGGSHVLVNRERVKLGIRPLCREKKLDEVAAGHARKMAILQQLKHSSLKITMKKVLDSGPCRLIGENISKGTCARKIHMKMMKSRVEDRNNILDRRYTSFGVGSAKSDSDELYIVHIYKG
jgi:hypothetical protein